MPNERQLAPTLCPQDDTTIGLQPSGPYGGHGEVLRVLRLVGIGERLMPFDTTQGATPRNSGQPLARKSA